MSSACASSPVQQAARWCGVLALAAALSSALIAAPPAWVKPYLAEKSWQADAPAVRLLDSGGIEYFGADRAKRTFRIAIRVNAEAGRSLARFSIGYDGDVTKVLQARAWVIAPDGRRTKDFQRNDFVETVADSSRRIWNSARRLSFDASSYARIGSVVAWEVEIEKQAGIFDAGWGFQHALPTWRSEFEATPSAGNELIWFARSSRVPAPQTGARPGSLRWEMREVPRLDPDGHDSFLADDLAVSVRCAPAGASDNSWAELSRRIASFIEPQIVLAPEVVTRARELAAGKKDRWATIRALTEFVQADISYLSMNVDPDVLDGYRPNATNEVLQCRYGDCKDKAALLVAMLRALDFGGRLVLVYATDPRAVEPRWPSASFNHAITAIPADDDVPAHWPQVSLEGLGRFVLFDATDPHTPLGALPVEDQGGHGLIVAPAGGGLVPLPACESAQTGRERNVHILVQPDGAMTANAEEVCLGNAGASCAALRSHLRDGEFQQHLEKLLHGALSSAQDVKWSDGWDAQQAAYRLKFAFSSPGFGRLRGRSLMLLTPQVLAAPGQLEPWKTTASGESWVPADRLAEEIRLTLPEGFGSPELPEPWSAEHAGVVASATYRLDGRDVVFRGEFRRPAGFHDRVSYEAMRTLAQAFATAQRRPIVLQRE